MVRISDNGHGWKKGYTPFINRSYHKSNSSSSCSSKKPKPFQRKYINFWNYFLKLFLNVNTGFGYFILTAYQFNSQSMGWLDKHRSSHWRCSVKKGVLKNFTNFIGKHLWSQFLVLLQAWLAATLLKRDSSTGVFLWNLLLLKISNSNALTHDKSLITCNFHNDKQIWKSIHLRKIFSDIAFKH